MLSVERQKRVCDSSLRDEKQSYSSQSGGISVHGLRGPDSHEFIRENCFDYIESWSLLLVKLMLAINHTDFWTKKKHHRHA